MTDLRQKMTLDISGKEKEILDEFCIAFFALKSSEGFPLERVFEEYTLCQSFEYEAGKITNKHWFEKRETCETFQDDLD